MDITEIKTWVARVKAKRVEGEPYPPDLRNVVAKHASERRKSGGTWPAIEAEVGLSHTTMRNWMRDRDTRGFQQLQVLDEPIHVVESAPTLISPHGFTVTGCSIEDIARLLVAVG